MPIPSVGAGFTQQEAVFQYPASGNQPPDRLLAADDNAIAQGLASQLYSLYDVLGHSSGYSMRTGPLEDHRVEAGIDENCQWKVAKRYHNTWLYTSMETQATGLSVPRLHIGTRVDTWHAACSWANSTPEQNNKPSITEEEPRGYASCSWNIHSKCGLHFTPHDQAIQRHIGVYFTATLDYRVPICSATSKCVNTGKSAWYWLAFELPNVSIKGHNPLMMWSAKA
ncbi:hypothetical protein ASPTUDRAFT_33132 [Aspergillus tubingensis CBS 134.48]|uniref:Uncharacterized protein n=1 Tax=Aspergillus tubingensis (strain CBS 134.48) TaxID=767770 RepID=A0A1L9MT31_ASPTC|nr:hypothetical protein ASPTUDRAFT_33132 [Aspergillus tubingensis CBS 134.48]